MPPKQTLTTEEIDALAVKFEAIGLNQAKARDAAKSPKIADPLKRLVETFKLSQRSVSDKQASLLVHFAPPSSKLPSDQERGYIVERIIDGRLKSTDQVNGESCHDCPFFLNLTRTKPAKRPRNTLKSTHHLWMTLLLIANVVWVRLVPPFRAPTDLSDVNSQGSASHQRNYILKPNLTFPQMLSWVGRV